MGKTQHEVRDPVHGFIGFDDFERTLIDSAPVQRLRDIHQLSMEFMVYPGATHKRFEHSLGVMHLAGRVFDNVFDEGKLSDPVRERIGNALERRKYWRQVLRLAGLLHDVGHMPFSHAGEGLLEQGMTHEHVTKALLESPQLRSALGGVEGGESEIVADVLDCCISEDKRKTLGLPGLESFKQILNDLVAGDYFGADRMDYLLRDAYYTGATYGRFDIDRLVSCLRVGIDDDGIFGSPGEPVLAVEEGGLHAAESLLLARYFMYEQVYYHRVRRVYDCHLLDFIKELRGGCPYPSKCDKVLCLGDSEVLAEMRRAALSRVDLLGQLARRIVERDHFRVVYQLPPTPRRGSREVFDKALDELRNQVGADNVRYFRKDEKTEEEGTVSDFAVLNESGEVLSAKGASEIFSAFPKTDIGYLFCPRGDCAKRACGIIKHIEAGTGVGAASSTGGADGISESTHSD